jgi:hypothetical protein
MASWLLDTPSLAMEQGIKAVREEDSSTSLPSRAGSYSSDTAPR